MDFKEEGRIPIFKQKEWVPKEVVVKRCEEQRLKLRPMKLKIIDFVKENNLTVEELLELASFAKSLTWGVPKDYLEKKVKDYLY